MITYEQASQKAFKYFDEFLNIKGIAEAMETPDKYIFCSGRKNQANIGGVTITIDKQSFEIAILQFPAKESAQIIKYSKELAVLKEFTVG